MAMNFDVQGLVNAIECGAKSEDLVKQFTNALNSAEKIVRERRIAAAEKAAEEKARAEAKAAGADVVLKYLQDYFPNAVKGIETPDELVQTLGSLEVSARRVNELPISDFFKSLGINFH